MELALEVEGSAARPVLPRGGATLVAFMSFAVSRGFGAQHPLIALADRLHALGVRIGPLTTFYEGDPEDAEDREKLELAWQPAADLREALEGLTAAVEHDELAHALLRRADAAGLPEEAAALLPTVRDAEAEGRRVRLSYTL